LAERSLERLVFYCQENQIPLLLVIVPRASEIQPQDLSKRIFKFTAERSRGLVERVARENEVPSLDLKKVLLAVQEQEPAYLAGDVHWSPSGHRAVAAAIFTALPQEWLRTPEGATLPGD
jgi:hypothetical protein